MFSLNMVQLIGNVGKDLEPKFTPSGKKVLSFSMAMNSKYNNAAGESVENTEWANCEIWEKGADILTQYAHKGSKLYVQGRLKTDKVVSADGSPTRYFTKIVVDQFMFLDGRNANETIVVAPGSEDAAPASDEVIGFN